MAYMVFPGALQVHNIPVATHFLDVLWLVYNKDVVISACHVGVLADMLSYFGQISSPALERLETCFIFNMKYWSH